MGYVIYLIFFLPSLHKLDSISMYVYITLFSTLSNRSLTLITIDPQVNNDQVPSALMFLIDCLGNSGHGK